MTNTVVYTLQSHDFGLLPAQLQMIRAHVQNLARIVVVQGPYGNDPMYSGGNRTLPPTAAAELGVETLELGEETGGLLWTAKIAAAIHMAKLAACDSAERFALVLHADAMPIRDISVSSLLPGKAMAASIQRTRGAELQVDHAWTAFDTEHGEAKRIQSLGGRLRQPSQCRTWPKAQVTRQSAEHMLRLQALADVIDLEQYEFELCGEWLLHLRGAQQRLETPETVATKLQVMAKALNLALEYTDHSIELTEGLRRFTPRPLGPMETTPFKKRRRSATRLQLPAAAVAADLPPFWGALDSWLQAGKPERGAEELDEIMSQNCDQCEYRTATNTCDACGCQIHGHEPALAPYFQDSDTENPLRNKARLATEHCPLWLW